MKKTEKQARLEHANALIKIIASHGRRFFWHGGVNRWNPATKTSTFEPADRYACLELRNGRVYLIDDYTEKAIYTHKTTFGNKWRGFSHGGTLRSLVEDMRDYIMHGTPIPRWKIVIQQLGAEGLEGNIWGYDVEGAQAVRDAAYTLPIIAAKKHYRCDASEQWCRSGYTVADCETSEQRLIVEAAEADKKVWRQTPGKEEEMKATLQVELQPFQTPNFVRAVSKPGLKQDGMQELPCYPLSDLDSLTLDKLCDKFRAEVFQKAGKEQPPRQG